MGMHYSCDVMMRRDSCNIRSKTDK